MNIGKIKAFTLAEVLITLCIIGVVAAITIPALLKNIQDYQFKQAWKKEYSVISQAYLSMKQDEGGDLSAYFDTAATRAAVPLFQKMGNYLLTLQTCGTLYYAYVCGTPSASVDTAYKSQSGGSVSQYNLYYYQYVLKDGANFYARSHQPGRALIWIDVNGYGKGPNILGRDLYGMVMTKDKIVPMGATGTGVENTCNSTAFTCPSGSNFDNRGDCAGASCSMNYLSQ